MNDNSRTRREGIDQCTSALMADRTVEEHRAHMRLIDLLNEKETAEPDRTHIIRIFSFDSSRKGSAQSVKS
jgi:hypothetical protein